MHNRFGWFGLVWFSLMVCAEMFSVDTRMGCINLQVGWLFGCFFSDLMAL